MPKPELDFSQWCGYPMISAPNDSGFFRSASKDGLILTETAYFEGHTRTKDRTFWSATIRIGIYHVSGNDFSREEARAEALEKIKKEIQPLLGHLKALGILNPDGT